MAHRSRRAGRPTPQVAHALVTRRRRVPSHLELGVQAHVIDQCPDAHAILEKHRGSKRLTHREVGDLAFDYEVLELQGDGELQLVTRLAADAATATRRATLTGGPGGRRLVEGR